MKNKINELKRSVALYKATSLILGVLLLVSFSLNLYVSFGNASKDDEGGITSSKDSGAFTMPDKVLDYNLADCVKSLGEYKGLEVPVSDPDNLEGKLTAEDYADYVLSELETTYTVPKGDKTEEGDIVTLNIYGTVDGVKFDGGEIILPDYEIGTETYFEGFDKYLTGIKVGSKKAKTFKVTLPEDFNPFPGETGDETAEKHSSGQDLAGKVAEFKVTIDDAQRAIMYDSETITDSVLAANTTYKTVKEFMKYCEEFSEEYNDYYDKQSKRSSLLDEIIRNSEVRIPEKYLNQELAIYILQYTNMYASNYESLEEYLEAEEQLTYEEFLEESRERLNDTLVNLAVSQKLAELEKVKLTDKDLQEYVKTLVEGSSFEDSSAEDVFKMYDTKYMSGKEFTSRMALSTKVLDELLEFQTFVTEAEEEE